MNNKTNKPLRKITLPQDSNDLNHGSDGPEKLGSKSMATLLAEKQELEDQVKRLKNERQEKETKQRQEFMRRVVLDPTSEEAQKYMYDRTQQQRQEIMDRQEQEYAKKQKIAEDYAIEQERKLTPEQRQLRDKKRLEIEQEKKKEITKLEQTKADFLKRADEFFAMSDEQFETNNKASYLVNLQSGNITSTKTLESSPVAILIDEIENGFRCNQHPYNTTASSTVGAVERHIRIGHKELIYSLVAKQFNEQVAEIEERFTPEGIERKFRADLAAINHIKTRPDGALLLSKKKK
jgi:hypothetical protein